MANLFRLGFQSLTKNIPSLISHRGISVSSVSRLKEIQETKNGKELIIEGVYVQSPNAHLLVKPEIPVLEGGRKPCFMCALDLDLKHTDVMILSQFQRTDGCALPSRVTGLCKRQQRRVVYMIRMAQKAGLMMNMAPKGSNLNPRKRKDDKKFNTYFDERTIFAPKEPKQRDRFKR